MNKTERMMKNVLMTATASVLAFGMSGCSSDDRPPKPKDDSCDDWEWDNDTEAWQCDDDSSPRFGYFFWGGAYYATANALKKNSSYKSYINKAKSGIGSGSKGGFGG
ncbi:hypothetical protein GKZ89_14310 [Bacillus mangrovi]|uniref:Aminotransferase yhxA n=1 Tax=Metabacillus mangrovi TaxID=1491830 RepID=A0A7X2S6I7_9BACI|nr:hypothetical protein [Metabacillus mangrovi]